MKITYLGKFVNNVKQSFVQCVGYTAMLCTVHGLHNNAVSIRAYT